MASKTLKISDTAAIDINSALYYINNELANPKAAIDLFSRISEVFDSIANFPEAYPLVQFDFEFHKNIRKVQIKNYVLFYSYNKKDKEVIILRFIYSKRSIDNLLTEVI